MKWTLLCILICLPASVFAFPDNSEARVQLREMITAPTGDVLEARDRTVEQILDGSEVSFQVKLQNDAFYLCFINESDGKFPVFSKGSYIIKRNLSDGKFIQIKVFLKNHTECYARIFPMDDRAVMEIILYGKIIYSDINLPFSFAEALTESFAEIIDSTSGIIDWPMIFPETDFFLFEQKMKLSDEIRQNLPLMYDVDDGALDADGTWVFIEDLSPQPEDQGGFNCSGFVKWVADGINYAETGGYLSVAELKSKQTDQRGNRWSLRHEDDRDPYFGLDWNRNIAVKIAGIEHPEDSDYKSADVKDLPWADYVEDVGFPIEELKLLMYYLAVTEPEYIYLASVNIPWGTAPVLRQHIHTAVLIPMLDKENGYSDIVFERNTESNSEILADSFKGAHVHLVRIRVDAGFRLPELRKTPDLGAGSYFRR